MSFGGYGIYPRRFGGGKSRVQIIHESLLAQRGTAYSPANQTQSSVFWLQNYAIARAIAASWSTNQRLANQADPRRMTDFLPRWEKILAIPVPADATSAERRDEVLQRFTRIGRAFDDARIIEEAQRTLGPFYVAVEYIDISIANVHSPDGSYPWGTIADGHPWYSTVAHILILVEKPIGYTEAEFWERVNALAPVMDAIKPVWATWDWYHAPTVGTPLDIDGGPSRAGWYLDEPNLDRLVLDDGEPLSPALLTEGSDPIALEYDSLESLRPEP